MELQTIDERRGRSPGQHGTDCLARADSHVWRQRGRLIAICRTRTCSPGAKTVAVLAALAFQNQAQSQPQPSLRAPPASEFLEAARFSINAFVLEGNTQIPTADLQEALKPLLGSGKRIADLGLARATVLEAYRRRGYELVSVDYDARKSRVGIHHLTVREVRIGKVAVTGVQALSEAGVRAQLPALMEGETPRLGQLARELNLFNDNPGRSATLAYSARGTGITDVEVKVVEQPPLGAALTLDNTGSEATGRLRLGGVMTHNNLWDRGHTLSASYATSERPARFGQYGLFYRWPLPALGDALLFFASHSDADSGQVAGLFNVSGKGTVYGVRYQRNLYQDLNVRHTLDLGLEERRYRDTIDFFGTDLGVPVTARPWSTNYQFRLQEPGRAVAATLGYWRNVAGGARNDDRTYDASRAGARADWHAWRMNFSAQHALVHDWLGSVRAEGQYANEPLISSERFGPGGMRGVRGFSEREGLGDRGWRANLELFTPQFMAGNRFLVFHDLGRTSRLNPLPGEPARDGLSSVGLGWRYTPAQGGSSISLDWASVRNGSSQNSRGEQKVHLSLAWML